MAANEEYLECPKCGKRYVDVGDLDKSKRLGGHLTGKHGLSGEEYWAAMAQAHKEMWERRGSK